MQDEAIKELVSFVKDASPQVWEAAQRMTVVHAWLNLFWMLAGTGMLYGIYTLARRQAPKAVGDLRGLVYVLACVAGILPLVLFGTNLDGLVTKVFAFDWAVIQTIADLFESSSS